MNQSGMPSAEILAMLVTTVQSSGLRVPPKQCAAVSTQFGAISEPPQSKISLPSAPPKVERILPRPLALGGRIPADDPLGDMMLDGASPRRASSTVSAPRLGAHRGERRDAAESQNPGCLHGSLQSAHGVPEFQIAKPGPKRRTIDAEPGQTPPGLERRSLFGWPPDRATKWARSCQAVPTIRLASLFAPPCASMDRILADCDRPVRVSLECLP